MDMQSRIISNLEKLTNSTFYSEDIQQVIDELNNLKTMKDIFPLLNRDYRDNLNYTFNVKMPKQTNGYKRFLDNIEKLENTFSNDIDYI